MGDVQSDNYEWREPATAPPKPSGLHPRTADLVTQLDHARRRIGQLTIQLGEVMKAPPAAVPQSPSYDALLIIAQSVQGALLRAGVDHCDDPGEAIDVMRERYERRIAELQAPPAAVPAEVRFYAAREGE